MALHAQLLTQIGRRDRIPQLPRIGGVVRVVADGTGDSLVYRILFLIGGRDAPGRQRALARVALQTQWLVVVPAHFRVQRLPPLLPERMVRVLVARSARAGRQLGCDRRMRILGGVDVNARQGRRTAVGSLDMVEPRAVAVLALHVMIRRVRYLVVTGRTCRQIAILVHRVTADAALLSRAATAWRSAQASACLVLLPLSLVLDVAVAAVGLLRGGVEVAEEAAGRIGWRGEGWAVSKDRVGAGAEPGNGTERQRQGSEAGLNRGWRAYGVPMSWKFASTLGIDDDAQGRMPVKSSSCPPHVFKFHGPRRNGAVSVFGPSGKGA